MDLLLCIAEGMKLERLKYPREENPDIKSQHSGQNLQKNRSPKLSCWDCQGWESGDELKISLAKRSTLQKVGWSSQSQLAEWNGTWLWHGSCNFDTNTEFDLPRGWYENIKHKQINMWLGLHNFKSMEQTNISIKWFSVIINMWKTEMRKAFVNR